VSTRVQAETDRTGEASALPQPGARRFVKVPWKITVWFWVIKILTTAMGESTSDYLVRRFNPYLVVIGGFGLFVAALALQFKVQRYSPWVYWLAVLMVAVFGTMAADVLHIQFGVPYVASAAGLAVALAVIFTVWQASEGTLSIHSIYTRKREVFYWAAVLATFAMGTATGDLTAYTAQLGFLESGVLFVILFALPAIAYRFFNLNAILAFWIAYVLTRPLGASFADWLGKSHGAGGVGLGDGPVSTILLIAIVACVAYVARTGEDQAHSG
jgi:uncharacterized membrane-anchored protein